MKTIEDVPLFSISLKIMKYWSFLIVHNWRRYICIMPYVFINISQFADIYYSEGSIDAIVVNTYITVLFFNGTFRGVFLSFNHRRYEEIMDTVRKFYIELMDSKIPKLRKMLEEATNSANTIAKMNLALGCCTTFSFVIYPLFASERALPYGIYIPGIDKYESPYYELIYIVHVLISPMGCCMYIPFTNMIAAFIIFGILMCKVLQHELRYLQHLPPQDVRSKLKWCIGYHCQLISLIDAVNRLNTYIFFMEYLTVAAMMCAMLFLLVIVDTVGQTILVIFFIAMVLSQNSVMYYYANELYVQSLDVSVAAYDNNWYEFDVATQKLLQILIQHTQKPCSILVGNIYPMNLELLKTLLNVSFSYFTVLRRVLNNESMS